MREGLRLHDEVGSRICGAVTLQVLKLMWEEPSFWKELKICWELLLHSVEVACQVILSSNLVHPWEMIDLLERFHILPAIQRWCYIRPLYIPLNLRIPGIPIAQLPIEVVPANLTNDLVLRVVHVEDDPLWFCFQLLLRGQLLGLLLLRFLW